MAATIFLSVDPAVIQIQAGGRASARITLLNRGDTVGQYVLDVHGLQPGWMRLDTAQLGVFPGDKAASQLHFHPADDALPATYRVSIRVVNQVDAADAAEVLVSLTVQQAGEAPAASPAGEVGVSSDVTVVAPRMPAGPKSYGEPSTTPKKVSAPAQPDKAVQATPAVQAVPAVQPAAAAVQAASATGQVLLSADSDSMKVPPGETSKLNLEVRNAGGVELPLELLVKGPPMSWLSIAPGSSITLGPGETCAVAVSVSIPDQAPLGSYPLTIQVQAVDEAQTAAGPKPEAVRLNLVLDVIKGGEVTVELSPRQMETETGADFSLALSQTGTEPVAVSLVLQENSGWLAGVFSPTNLTIPPAGRVSSRLNLRARRPQTDSDSLPVPFTVAVIPAGGGPAVTTQGQLVLRRAAPLQLALQPLEVSDAGRAVFSLRVHNPGQSPVTVRLTAGDADGGCTYPIEPPSLVVPARGEGNAVLTVVPRQLVDRGEIIHSFTVQALPAGGSPLRVEGRYIQTASPAPALTLVPTSQTGPEAGVYSVQVHNPRAVPVQVALRPFDPGNQCQFSVEPQLLSLPPNGQAVARLEVRPASDLLPGERRRMCTFQVAGYVEGLPNPLVANGSFLLVEGLTWRKLLPYFVVGFVLLGLGALAVLVLAYMAYFP
jgi:hypothetical protein